MSGIHYHPFTHEYHPSHAGQLLRCAPRRPRFASLCSLLTSPFNFPPLPHSLPLALLIRTNLLFLNSFHSLFVYVFRYQDDLTKHRAARRADYLSQQDHRNGYNLLTGAEFVPTVKLPPLPMPPKVRMGGERER